MNYKTSIPKKKPVKCWSMDLVCKNKDRPSLSSGSGLLDRIARRRQEFWPPCNTHKTGFFFSCCRFKVEVRGQVVHLNIVLILKGFLDMWKEKKKRERGVDFKTTQIFELTIWEPALLPLNSGTNIAPCVRTNTGDPGYPTALPRHSSHLGKEKGGG